VQLTLWRDLGAAAPLIRELPSGCLTVPCSDVPLPDLGELYFAAYPPSQGSPTVDDAIADMAATLAGTYGQLIREASCAVLSDGRPVSVVQTVLRAPWPDVQAGPFVIELFTAPTHRNQGLGRHLLQRTIVATAAVGERWLGLRVDSENHAALRVYRCLDFREWNTD